MNANATKQKEISEPKRPTVKRLFACSGNCCAFPNCKTLIWDGRSLTGEICHIKGQKPDAPRYDALQTAEERHSYDNLILLCPTHHTVIDDNEDYYTVELLQQMKAAHESNATPIKDVNEDQITQALVSNSVVSIGQTGGITAGVVNINLAPGPSKQKAALAAAKKFRDERINQINAGNFIKPLESMPCIAVHAIPIPPFEEDTESKDYVNSVRQSGRFWLAPLGRSLPMYGTTTGFNVAANSDGAVTFTVSPKTPTYTQLFRSGAIEGVHIFGVTDDGKPYFHNNRIAMNAVYSLHDYFCFMNEADIPTPVLVSVTLCNTKGTYMRNAQEDGFGWEDIGPCATTNIILGDVVLHQFNDDLPQKMKDVFDVLWNTFGLPKCSMYDDNGMWKGTDRRG